MRGRQTAAAARGLSTQRQLFQSPARIRTEIRQFSRRERKDRRGKRAARNLFTREVQTVARDQARQASVFVLSAFLAVE